MWLYADIRTLGDIPRHYAQISPDKTALVDAGGTLSFRGLDEASNRIAQGLQALEIPPRSHIGYLGKNAIPYFVALFGAAKAGCAVAPLNWRLARPELAAILSDAACPLVFVDTEFMPVMRSIQSASARNIELIEVGTADGISKFDQWLSSHAPVDPDLPVDCTSTALLMYTSGTTGEPKGVQITHEGLGYMRLCEHLEPALQWKVSDVMLTIMPVFHLVGTGLSLQALYNGSTVSLLPALDPGHLIKLIVRDRPTVIALVPTAIQMLLDHPDASRADFSSLRLVMYAGSPIDAALLTRAIGVMKCNFMQFYGATETGGAATLLRPEQHVLDDEARLKSCGTPLPLIEFKVLDTQNRELGAGEIGEIVMRSPALFVGYLNKAEATAAVLQRGWYRTGDAGFRDADGLFYIVDRIKDMIVTGGENVYSAEVEQALVRHPAIRQCAVIGLPDDKWGERVVAALVLRDGVSPQQDDILVHCRGRIAGYKVPKQLFFVESLPMTPSGKVLKRVLRETLLDTVRRAT